MLNEVARHVFSAVVRSLADHRPLTRTALDGADIPSPIRDYIDARLAREAERAAEAIKARRDPWVAENAEVSRARTALSIAASRSVQVPAVELDDLVREATTIVVRYLVRPARTLVDVIFSDDQDDIAVEDAIERMASLHAYGYFDDVLSHYFAEKQVERVDRARLDSVLHRVDRQMTSDFTTEEWLQVISPLFDTLATAMPYREGVPAELLRMYFREKEAGDILERLDPLHGDEVVSRERLRDVLDSPLIVDQAIEEPEETVVPSPVEPASSRRQSAPAPSTAPDPESGGPVPLWKQFQGHRPPAAETSDRKAPAARPAKAASDDAPGTPLWKRYRAPAPESAKSSPPERTPVSARPSLQDTPSRREAEPSLDAIEREVLGSRGHKNRKMFVSQIFGGSTDAYRKALLEITRATTWSDASRYIAREVFMRNDVNIYDDAAVAFTDLVEERFAEQHRP
jgi:hypothetical protein